MGNTLAVEVKKVDHEQWEAQARDLLSTADAFVVADVPSQDRAAAFIVRINAEIKAVKDTFALPKERAHQAHKSMCDVEKKHLGQREQAKRIVKAKIGQFQTEQERQRQEEKARRDREALKRAEDEALERAELLEADGRKEEAEAALAAPVVTPTMPAPPPPPKPVGVQTRVYWKFDVVDAGAVPRAYMEPDIVKLGAYARSMKETAKMDGVEFYSERY